MLGVNYVKAGSVAAVVQCGEAIVWSPEHFYLVALRGGGRLLEDINAQINKH